MKWIFSLLKSVFSFTRNNFREDFKTITEGYQSLSNDLQQERQMRALENEDLRLRIDGIQKSENDCKKELKRMQAIIDQINNRN